MKRTSSFLLAVATTWLCFAAIDAQSQEDEVAAPAPCDRVRCYQPGPIPLTLDDGSEASFELQVAVPIVSDDVVSMLPGTTVFVRGDVADGKLANLRVVEKPAELNDVLQIRMWQEPKMADTFLVVTNHFHEIIKYRAAMLLPQSENFRRTSSCPVLGDGRVGYEHWPHTIVQLLLVDFAFVGADAGEFACEQLSGGRSWWRVVGIGFLSLIVIAAVFIAIVLALVYAGVLE